LRLSEIYKNQTSPVISFEVFPPKGDGEEYKQKVDKLFNELNILKQFNPQLISVTYGAGGSTREKTFDLVLNIKKEMNIEPMAHFTCVNFNKKQILEYVKKLEDSGIENILALRGDPPIGIEHFIAPENGFSHASELVKYIKENTNLSVAVAGYPEKHPEAISFEDDLKYLTQKVNLGADVIYTQLFFDNNDYFKFVDKLNKLGINKPIIPGIMVIQTFNQIDRIINLSGSKIPKNYLDKITKYQNSPEDLKQIGIEYSIEQVKELKSNGVKGLHFYPLNKSYAVSEVIKNI